MACLHLKGVTSKQRLPKVTPEQQRHVPFEPVPELAGDKWSCQRSLRGVASARSACLYTSQVWLPSECALSVAFKGPDLDLLPRASPKCSMRGRKLILAWTAQHGLLTSQGSDVKAALA
mmetsp:Transcript_26739/g.70235  ORF Transcript_26739/g.70235 Transcript_26739/m.70235 type:complete len:119 (-) Transcript_26739:162-518(-)